MKMFCSRASIPVLSTTFILTGVPTAAGVDPTCACFWTFVTVPTVWADAPSTPTSNTMQMARQRRMNLRAGIAVDGLGVTRRLLLESIALTKGLLELGSSATAFAIANLALQHIFAPESRMILASG